MREGLREQIQSKIHTPTNIRHEMKDLFIISYVTIQNIKLCVFKFIWMKIAYKNTN